MPFQDVTIPSIDLQVRAKTRTLAQFLPAPVFQAVLQGLISEVAALQLAIENVMRYRLPPNATGENLNALGRIVGQDRMVLDYSLISWLQPDTSGQSVDQAPVWVKGAHLGGNYRAGDNWFRVLILAKIYRNMARYGSVPEVQNAIKMALGFDVSFVHTAPMEAAIYSFEALSLWVLEFLTGTSGTNPHVDNPSYPPYPDTFRISGIIYLSVDYFAPDLSGSHRVDVGKVAVQSHF